jgi:pyrroline-5-carboxylate reductase
MDTLKNQRFAFVGSGAMAEAMIRGLTRRAGVPGERIVASGPRAERGEELRERCGVLPTTDNRAAVAGATLVVLSVKPQVLHGVLEEVAGRVKRSALVISIVAGARYEAVAASLGHTNIVRAMPNTPAQVGLGMTVWTAPPTLDERQRAQARAVFASVGEELFVGDERYLDMATALSGTGPAYMFLFMEAMVDAGVHMGFSRHVAERLVFETARGSVEYARHAGQHLAALRNQVTSSGGTCAEALYHIEKGGLRTVMSRAVWAAYQKSRRLGKGVEE